MLGRTDSRTRLLLLLVVFIVASVALMGRLAYWQILQRDDLAAKAVAQTTVRLEEPTRRGEIYDRSGTVVLATTVERDRLVAATDKLTDEQRRSTGDELVRILALDPEPPRPRCATASRAARPTSSWRARSSPRSADAIRGGQRCPDDHRDHARAGADARLSAVRRQPGLDAGRPPHGLREPRRQGPVRRRAGLPGRPGRQPAHRPGGPRRERPDAARPGPGRGPGRARPGRSPDHRRGPAAGGRTGAPRRVGRRQGQERLGRRHGSVHGRDLRRGDRPRIRREQVPPDRGRRRRSASSTRSSRTSTSLGPSSR